MFLCVHSIAVETEHEKVSDREIEDGGHAQIFAGDSMEKLEIVRVINC